MLILNDIEYNMLVPATKKSMYLAHTIMAVVVVLATVGGWFYLRDIGRIATLCLIVASAVLIVLLMIYPILYYRYYRYAITGDRIDTRQGVFIRTHTVVPIERLHQVEVVRGPINGLFGLANVSVTTAGGVASIKYLEVDVAESIVSELNEVINKILRDRNADA